MTDLIMSVPWTCDHKDGCPTGWHLSHYWTVGSGSGYTIDTYGDGDHEYLDEEDLPTPEEFEEAWGAYYIYVAESGEDPLGELNVKHSYVKKRRFSAVLIRGTGNHETVRVHRWRSSTNSPWRYDAPKQGDSLHSFLLLSNDQEPWMCETCNPLTGKNTYYTLEEVLELAESDPVVQVTKALVGGELQHITISMTLELMFERSPETVRLEIRRAAAKDIRRRARKKLTGGRGIK
jgi:hypothetical protein